LSDRPTTARSAVVAADKKDDVLLQLHAAGEQPLQLGVLVASGSGVPHMDVVGM